MRVITGMQKPNSYWMSDGSADHFDFFQIQSWEGKDGYIQK